VNISEKISILILCFFLFVGAMILHKNNSRPFKKIFVVKNKIDLQSIEEELKEKQKVNINTASADVLTYIPGVGQALAEEIMKRRDRYGSFTSENELLEVKGIGKKKLNKMKDFIKM